MNLDLIQVALSVYGIEELVGSGNNKQIMQMAKEAGFEHDYLSDEVAWCSMFANWVALKAGYERSKKLNARSWLDIGQPVTQPETGDVVILWRNEKTSAFGHVGFFVNFDPMSPNKFINILAGNQGNKVGIEEFNIERLLGYRRLKKIA